MGLKSLFAASGRVCAFAVALVALVGIHVPAQSQDVAWWLRLPKVEKVEYHGVVSFDEAGSGAGGMLYPAPNAAGLLVAVITHGVLVESIKSSQKQKMQETADKVLAPYQAILDSYKHAELMKAALQRSRTPGDKQLIGADQQPGAGWVIESVPVFAMTQDQTALVLDNAVSVLAPGATEPAFKAAVRVVSAPLAGDEPASLWAANDGSKLKEESSALLAESLDIAVRQAAGGFESKGGHRTVRYSEGRAERMERAELLADQCQRLTLKTLRGDIMSVPSRKSAEDCAAAAPK